MQQSEGKHRRRRNREVKDAYKEKTQTETRKGEKKMTETYRGRKTGGESGELIPR